MKVILNKCYGGFGVSHERTMLYAKKKGFALYSYKLEKSISGYVFKKTDEAACVTYYFKKDYGDRVREKEIDWGDAFYIRDEYREDPVLIECVEELGKKANSSFSNLKIVEIPDGMKYVIDDYDGIETLHADVPCW